MNLGETSLNAPKFGSWQLNKLLSVIVAYIWKETGLINQVKNVKESVTNTSNNHHHLIIHFLPRLVWTAASQQQKIDNQPFVALFDEKANVFNYASIPLWL